MAINVTRWIEFLGEARRRLAGLASMLLISLPLTATNAQTGNGAIEIVQRAVAVVNEDVISQYDVDRRLSLVMASTGGNLSDQEKEQLRAQILRGLVDEKLQLQEARENDISVPPDMISGYFERVAANFNQTPEQFEKFLIESGTTRLALEEQIRAEIAWSQLVQRRLDPQVNIGDEEVDDVLQRLEESKGQFEYHLAEIFITSTAQTEDQVKLTAERIVERVRQGTPFESYARQFSEAASAAVGGDMGWLIESRLSADTLLTVRDMAVNNVSDPIRVAGGYQILLLKDRRRVLSVDPLDLQLDIQQMFWALNTEMSEADREAALKRVAAGVPRNVDCANLSDLGRTLNATETSTVGSLRLRDLPPNLRNKLEPLEPGQAAEPLPFPSGIRVLVVCDRRDPEVEPPSFDDIYEQLNQQRLSMMARRYLRDLRRDAIVDYR